MPNSSHHVLYYILYFIYSISYKFNSIHGAWGK